MVLWGSESIMKMYISSRDLFEMLSKYYSELLGEEVKVNYNFETVYQGYGINEYASHEVQITYVIEHKLEGAVLRVNNTLDHNDINLALNAILGKIGYLVEDFVFETETVGYGRDEEEEFKGLSVRVNKKGMEMKLEQ